MGGDSVERHRRLVNETANGRAKWCRVGGGALQHSARDHQAARRRSRTSHRRQRIRPHVRLNAHRRRSSHRGNAALCGLCAVGSPTAREISSPEISAGRGDRIEEVGSGVQVQGGAKVPHGGAASVIHPDTLVTGRRIEIAVQSQRSNRHRPLASQVALPSGTIGSSGRQHGRQCALHDPDRIRLLGVCRR